MPVTEPAGFEPRQDVAGRQLARRTSEPALFIAHEAMAKPLMAQAVQGDDRRIARERDTTSPCEPALDPFQKWQRDVAADKDVIDFDSDDCSDPWNDETDALGPDMYNDFTGFQPLEQRKSAPFLVGLSDRRLMSDVAQSVSSASTEPVGGMVRIDFSARDCHPAHESESLASAETPHSVSCGSPITAPFGATPRRVPAAAPRPGLPGSGKAKSGCELTIEWHTGLETVLCSARCMEFAELLAELPPESLNPNARHIECYTDNLCGYCKAQVLHDIAAVRRAFRTIYVLQAAHRWRMRLRQRLLRDTQRLGGLSPQLVAAQTASTKGRCNRCVPFLANLRERIHYFRRKNERAEAKHQHLQASPRFGRNLLNPAESPSDRPGSFTLNGAISVTSHLSLESSRCSAPSLPKTPRGAIRLDCVGKRESACMATSANRLDRPPHAVSPTSSEGTASSVAVSQNAKGGVRAKEQFVRDLNGLIFEMCDRCREIARAEVRTLREGLASRSPRG